MPSALCDLKRCGSSTVTIGRDAKLGSGSSAERGPKSLLNPSGKICLKSFDAFAVSHSQTPRYLP